MIDWTALLSAVGLALIFEALLPFLSPGRWREAVARLSELPDAQLRQMGAFTIFLGVLILLFVR